MKRERQGKEKTRKAGEKTKKRKAPLLLRITSRVGGSKSTI